MDRAEELKQAVAEGDGTKAREIMEGWLEEQPSQAQRALDFLTARGITRRDDL